MFFSANKDLAALNPQSASKACRGEPLTLFSDSLNLTGSKGKSSSIIKPPSSPDMSAAFASKSTWWFSCSGRLQYSYPLLLTVWPSSHFHMAWHLLVLARCFTSLIRSACCCFSGSDLKGELLCPITSLLLQWSVVQGYGVVIIDVVARSMRRASTAPKGSPR